MFFFFFLIIILFLLIDLKCFIIGKFNDWQSDVIIKSFVRKVALMKILKLKYK